MAQQQQPIIRKAMVDTTKKIIPPIKQVVVTDTIKKHIPVPVDYCTKSKYADYKRRLCFDSTVQQNVIMLLDKVDPTFVNEAKNAMDRYNGENYRDPKNYSYQTGI